MSASSSSTAGKLRPVSAALLAIAIRRTATPAMITNRNGRIIWANQALSSLTGYGINELEGSTPGLFKSGVQDHAFYLQLWKTIAAGAVWHGQIVDRRKDGSLFTVEEIVTPLLSSHGIPRHYVATLQDITAREASH